MKDKRISSALTPLVKLVFPIAWLVGFGVGTLGDWLAASPGRVESLIVWLGGYVFILAMCGDIMRVRVSAGKLLASNYLTEIEIPAAAIVEVSENRWNSIRPVTLCLDQDTRFGRKIRFMPKLRWFWIRTPHPIVAELSQFAKPETRGRALS